MSTSESILDLGVFESHVLGKLRDRYSLSKAKYSETGMVVLHTLPEVRLLAMNINKLKPYGKQVSAGELLAASLLGQAFQLLIKDYENFAQNIVFEECTKYVIKHSDKSKTTDLLTDFVMLFPPGDVYNGKVGIPEWLNRESKGIKNDSIILKEFFLVMLSNANPAKMGFRDLFDRAYMENQVFADTAMSLIEEYFAKLHVSLPDRPNLVAMLKAPMLHAPDNLYAQLNYVLNRWSDLLPEDFRYRLLQGRDFIKEEFVMLRKEGSVPTVVPRYKEAPSESALLGKSGFDYGHESPKLYEEYKAFTPDTHWMPKVVLIAKNALVWLDQLSKIYQRDIKRLDQIPDEELEKLRAWGINSLWLIGLWQRSDASRRVKHISGFTDAVSSAYSLYDYEIAREIGGEEAYQTLNERARAKGIRLASDMVPNHTGVFSKWIIENPEYFIQAPQSPFPNYRFNGPNLSSHPDIEIRIEDGYYSKTDAAVVFQRIDRRTGDVRYIYHGNDGTNMPWNDTAQLDMLKHEVRQAVINKIFDVAKRFSIIRFDAAMTLVKKHFSRLWYPSPGSGGDIPSRSDFSMRQSVFDALFPNEFWREVVDKINAEMPETLLLAEAFWLMEGYFVRTLGMHRVYNSAFMHMLKNEENKKYRELITNTLEFEPEILKRYVNFMSNPDEETAINQFGTGDKYFGVCVLMCTLPGLPMFAHGQVEGLSEKYGMEYQRAYHDEPQQQWLIDKHKKDIFPLLAKRYLFSEVEHFNYFAAHRNGTAVLNEDVMAFTNRSGNEKVLVLYNNKYERATGIIKISYPKLYADGMSRSLNINEALGLNVQNQIFYICKEHVSGLNFILKPNDLRQLGWRYALNGFEYRIFWEFYEVRDQDGSYDKLYQKFGNSGIANLNRALLDEENHEVYECVPKILNEENLKNFFGCVIKQPYNAINPDELSNFQLPIQSLLGTIETKTDFRLDKEAVLNHFQKGLIVWQAMGQKASVDRKSSTHTLQEYPSKLDLNPWFTANLNDEKSVWPAIFLLLMDAVTKGTVSKGESNILMEKLQLTFSLPRFVDKILFNQFNPEQILGNAEALMDFRLSWQQLPKIESHSDKATASPLSIKQKGFRILNKMLEQESVRNVMGVNFYNHQWFFHKEAFENLLCWMLRFALFDRLFVSEDLEADFQSKEISSYCNELSVLYQELLTMSANAGYNLHQFKELIASVDDTSVDK